MTTQASFSKRGSRVTMTAADSIGRTVGVAVFARSWRTNDVIGKREQGWRLERTEGVVDLGSQSWFLAFPKMGLPAGCNWVAA